jgi:hypothetical protein
LLKINAEEKAKATTISGLCVGRTIKVKEKLL